MSTAVNVNISHAPSIASDTPARGLTIALWIAQILLALVFGFAGAMKIFTPIAELAKNAAWIKDSEFLIRFIGISELSGGLETFLSSLCPLCSLC
jgi:putative oxidoreductase